MAITHRVAPRLVLSSAFACLFSLAATACGGGGDGGGNGPDGGVATVEVSPESSTLFSLAPGNTATLTVVARDDDDQVIGNVDEIAFTSANTAVATVTADGEVTAAGAGSTQVTATVTHAGVTKSGSATITVQVAPAAVTVTAPQLAFLPATVDVGAGGQVTWSIAAVHHDVTFTTAGSPANIPTIENASESRAFPTPGFYQYVCSLHAGMTGTVRVH